jgi:Ulp1 family protease
MTWISQQIPIPRQSGNTECGVIMLEVARRLLFKQSLDFSVADRDIAVLRSRFATELRARQLTMSTSEIRSLYGL